MKRVIFFTLLMMLIFSSVYALEVYVRPPKMIARINLTETNTWRGFIEVKNNNNETVNVTFKPTGNITDKISIAKQVQLKPGELRQENFTITVKNPGVYEGGVLVTYIKEGEIPIALQAEIITIATGITDQKNNNYTYIYFSLPLLLALIIRIFYKRSRR